MSDRTSDMDQHDFDLRSRIVNLEHGSTGHGNRLTALELWTRQRDVTDARRDEQLSGIKEDLKTIKVNISWIVKLILGGIVLGVIAFMMAGGFKVP
jgi:hypothetical protein